MNLSELKETATKLKDLATNYYPELLILACKEACGSPHDDDILEQRRSFLDVLEQLESIEP